jgi:hypothetical protein
MKPLILTTDSSAAGSIWAAGFADLAITLARRLVWGPAPSDSETATFFAARMKAGLHWQDCTPQSRLEKSGGIDLGLIEFCARYEAVELWIDPDPNAQLTLIWLLSFLRFHDEVVEKLSLIQADSTIGNHPPEVLAKSRPPTVKISKDHLEAACLAWRAYCAPTPHAWSDLLKTDLSVLPQFHRIVVELLQELPGRDTGLGATEMRMLELISEGGASPGDVFPGHRKRNKRRVFHFWEIGELLDGLANGPMPAVTGLDEGPFTIEMCDDRVRRRRYQQSKLSLTPFGADIVAGREDFSHHNPIHRWWGGTELTNDRLWRWGPTLIEP